MEKIKSRTAWYVTYMPSGEENTEWVEDKYISTVVHYDEWGNPISEEQYDPDGQVTERYIRTFSGKDIVASEQYETGEEGLVSSKVYERDSSGRLIREQGSYMEGGSENIHYMYSEDGLLLSRTAIDDEGDEEYREDFQYDNGMLVKERRWDYGDLVFELEKTYHENGMLASEEERNLIEKSRRGKSFLYDDAGRISIESLLVDGKLLSRKTYTYDSEGRLGMVKEEEAFRRDELHIEYDERGHAYLQKDVDKDGNVFQEVRRTFADNGLLLKVEVSMDGSRTGIARRYAIEYEYTFYPGMD